MSDKRLIVVVGPTGSGKTDLSLRLASGDPLIIYHTASLDRSVSHFIQPLHFAVTFGIYSTLLLEHGVYIHNEHNSKRDEGHGREDLSELKLCQAHPITPF
mgnify:CR=1 FL=1